MQGTLGTSDGVDSVVSAPETVASQGSPHPKQGTSGTSGTSSLLRREKTGENKGNNTGVDNMKYNMEGYHVPEVPNVPSPPEYQLLGDKSVLGQIVETIRSEEHTSELQSQAYIVCRPLLEKKNRKNCTACKDTQPLS